MDGGDNLITAGLQTGLRLRNIYDGTLIFTALENSLHISRDPNNHFSPTTHVGKLRKPQTAKQGTCRCELLKQFHYRVPDHSNLLCSFRRRWCTCKLEGYKNRLQNIHVRRRQIVSPRRRNKRGFWHRRPTMSHKSLDFSAGHSQSSLLLNNRYNTSRTQLKT